MNTFRLRKKKLSFKLNEEQNLRKVADSLYVFLTTPDEGEKYVKMIQSSSSDNCVYCYNIKILNLFDPELLLINTKPMVKNNLKELLSELKKCKVWSISVVD